MEKSYEDVSEKGWAWTCANVFNHKDGKKVVEKERGNCPEPKCNRPLFKTKHFFVDHS